MTKKDWSEMLQKKDKRGQKNMLFISLDGVVVCEHLNQGHTHTVHITFSLVLFLLDVFMVRHLW